MKKKRFDLSIRAMPIQPDPLFSVSACAGWPHVNVYYIIKRTNFM